MSYDTKKETKRFLRKLGYKVRRDDSIESTYINHNLGTLHEQIPIINFCVNNPPEFKEALKLRDELRKEGIHFGHCPELETLRENLFQIIDYLSKEFGKDYTPFVRNYLGFQLKEMGSLLKGLEKID